MLICSWMWYCTASCNWPCNLFLSKPYCACPEIKLVSRLPGSQRPEVPANIHQIKTSTQMYFSFVVFTQSLGLRRTYLGVCCELIWGIYTHTTPDYISSPHPSKDSCNRNELFCQKMQFTFSDIFEFLPSFLTSSILVHLDSLRMLLSYMTKEEVCFQFFLSVLYICERIVSKARPSPSISNT